MSDSASRRMSDSDTPAYHRRIRSFVRREGRLTPAQSRALDALMPRYGVAAEAFADPAQLFERPAPLTLEIGFGDGENLLAACQQHPERNFLGFEVHRPGVGRLLDRADKAGVVNLKVSTDDAAETLAQSAMTPWIDSLYVLFPDPWHKKKHNKRRLIQAPLIGKLAARLKVGGYLHCATDWQPYAEQILEVLKAEPLLENNAALSHPELAGYAPKPHYRPLTKFENRGIKLGHGVWDVVFVRI